MNLLRISSTFWIFSFNLKSSGQVPKLSSLKKSSLKDFCYFIQGIKEIEYKHYISTSFTEKASNQFYCILKKHFQDGTFLQIKGDIEEGVSCGYLDKDISSMSDEEDEILIIRNTIFKIDEDSILIDPKEKTIFISGEFRKE